MRLVLSGSTWCIGVASDWWISLAFPIPDAGERGRGGEVEEEEEEEVGIRNTARSIVSAGLPTVESG